MLNTKFLGIIFVFVLLFHGCGNDYVPKPKGYIRFDLPNHTYQVFEDDCPYSFEIGNYSIIENRGKSEQCWKNVYIKPLKARIHLSYKKVGANLHQLLNDAHELVYEHSVKADAINEQVFFNSVRKVYGVLYSIKGDAASNLQFIATDSAEHYLRGALYFHAVPNKDSLAPLIEFARKDIEHMIETLAWK